MEQLSLFTISDVPFIKKVQDLLHDIMVSEELPSKSLHIFSNTSSKGSNIGNETSKSICIYEPEYPLIKEDVDNPGKNFVVMNIQFKSDVELLIRNRQFEQVSLPPTAKVKSIKSDTVFKHVVFKESDPSALIYIKDNVLYCLKNYRSKAKTFGCCSQFIRCSDEKRCVHVNKLYATACTYRHHLEAGKIFYGKNKNI